MFIVLLYRVILLLYIVNTIDIQKTIFKYNF